MDTLPPAIDLSPEEEACFQHWLRLLEGDSTPPSQAEMDHSIAYLDRGGDDAAR